MASRKTQRKSSTRKSPKAALSLEARVSSLEKNMRAMEKDVRALKGTMNMIVEDLSFLRLAVQQVDRRSIKGEQILMQLQGDQRRTFKVLESVARATGAHVPAPSAPPPPPSPQRSPLLTEVPPSPPATRPSPAISSSR